MKFDFWSHKINDALMHICEVRLRKDPVIVEAKWVNSRLAKIR